MHEFINYYYHPMNQHIQIRVSLNLLYKRQILQCINKHELTVTNTCCDKTYAFILLTVDDTKVLWRFRWSLQLYTDEYLPYTYPIELIENDIQPYVYLCIFWMVCKLIRRWQLTQIHFPMYVIFMGSGILQLSNLWPTCLFPLT